MNGCPRVECGIFPDAIFNLKLDIIPNFIIIFSYSKVRLSFTFCIVLLFFPILSIFIAYFYSISYICQEKNLEQSCFPDPSADCRVKCRQPTYPNNRRLAINNRRLNGCLTHHFCLPGILDGDELSKNSIYSIAAQLCKQKLSNDRPSQVHREIGIFGKYWRGIRKRPTTTNSPLNVHHIKNIHL